MKFIHLSDLHIGKILHGYSLKEDQEYILHQIIEQIGVIQPDAVVIAGDVYDKSAPSGEAVSIFSRFLTELAEVTPAVEVLLIAGNHDSMERLDYASSLLKKLHLHFACYLPRSQEERLERITFTDEWGEVDFYLLPFLKPGYVRPLFPEGTISSYQSAAEAMLAREQIDFSRRNVLVSHQFYTNGEEKPQICDSESPSLNIGGLDNIDISVVRQFDYVALGHIHGRQKVGAEHIRYCGTPLKYSVSEKNHKKSITVVTLKGKETAPVIEEILLNPLRDVRTETGLLEEILSGKPSQDYISVTLTDETEPYKPMERLKEHFPHLLELNLDNTRTRSRLQSFDQSQSLQNPMELFSLFYKEMQGQDLSRTQEQLIAEIFEEAGTEVES